jgi:phosphoribosyl 1,2-cyclic phosphodiesterase
VATVTFHGVRGSCPCSDPSLRRYGGATACVSVQPEEKAPPVVLDLGTGSRSLGEALMAKSFVDKGQTCTGLRLAIFVSHLHFDHVQGLPFFAPALEDEVELDIYAPRQEGQSLHDAFSSFVQPPYFPVRLDDLPAKVTFRELDDNTHVTVGENVSVLARVIPHSGRTLGYRVECDGGAVAYLSDHQAPRPCHEGPRVSPGVLDLADGVELLVHDAQYTKDEFGLKEHWGHSTIEFAVEVAVTARARKLVMFHHDPTHDDDALDLLGKRAQEMAGDRVEVVVAAEGLQLVLGH